MRRRRGQRVIVIVLMVVTLLMAALSCALALQMYRRTDPSLIGKWRMRLDLTDAARVRANAWLRNAELGGRVDAGDSLPQLTVWCELKLESDGTWTRTLDAGSLAYAETEARGALAAALNELLRLRVEEAGRPALTEKEAESRIRDVLGMTAEDYLSQYGPALLPDEGELRREYEGRGTYRIEGPSIRFDEKASARYLADDALLVIRAAEGTEVYERAK